MCSTSNASIIDTYSNSGISPCMPKLEVRSCSTYSGLITPEADVLGGCLRSCTGCLFQITSSLMDHATSHLRALACTQRSFHDELILLHVSKVIAVSR
jgi:hypothetical protein